MPADPRLDLVARSRQDPAAAAAQGIAEQRRRLERREAAGADLVATGDGPPSAQPEMPTAPFYRDRMNTALWANVGGDYYQVQLIIT